MSILGNWQISWVQTGIRNTDVSKPAFFLEHILNIRVSSVKVATAEILLQPWETYHGARYSTVPEHKGKGNFKSSPLGCSFCRVAPQAAAAAPSRSPWAVAQGRHTQHGKQNPQSTGTHWVPLWGTREGWLFAQIIAVFASIVRDS